MTKHTQEHNLLICILAAGKSKRMGQPKQLLNWNGNTLLNHTINQIIPLSTDCLVILGAYNKEILKTLDADIQIVINNDWKKGIAISIHKAVDYSLKHRYNFICFTVCDNPSFCTNHYQSLINIYLKNREKIIYTKYNDTWGTPIVFPDAYFSDLKSLNNDTGAKYVAKKYFRNTKCLKIKSNFVDIDTMKQYSYLKEKPSLYN